MIATEIVTITATATMTDIAATAAVDIVADIRTARRKKKGRTATWLVY
jgi:hypothetical protein